MASIHQCYWYLIQLWQCRKQHQCLKKNKPTIFSNEQHKTEIYDKCSLLARTRARETPAWPKKGGVVFVFGSMSAIFMLLAKECLLFLLLVKNIFIHFWKINPGELAWFNQGIIFYCYFYFSPLLFFVSLV